MTLEEHSTLMDAIRTGTDEVKRAEDILSIAEDYKKQLAEISDLKENIAKVEKERDDYARVNSTLWAKTSLAEGRKDPTDLDPNVEKLSFDDLKFD